ncbi:MAG: hypothetical protein JNL67_16400 [Planctomycetaceae bacterium]|nr:hypothetical protein [Planctomycetaceae bacterium]
MLDLFKSLVPPERFHPNFAQCVARPNQYDRMVLAKWADGFIDRDGKFIEEFQTTFNSCFWELYLHAVLKEAGCNIDFSHHAPDYFVTAPVPFLLEATVALNATDSLPEWSPLDLDNRPRDLNEFNRLAMIRLLNSISEKSKKYTQSYQKMPHVADKPFVLALAPFDRPLFYLQIQRAIEAVLYGYYVDEQESIDNPSTTSPLRPQRLRVVRKDNGVELPLGIFTDKTHEHISAVVFNSAATWGKVRAMCDDQNPFIYFNACRFDPHSGETFVFYGSKSQYQESLCDGLRVYHNPNAIHPLDWKVFQQPGAFQAVCNNSDTFELQYWMDRPPLVARNLITMVGRGDESATGEMAGTTEADLLNGGWRRMPFSLKLLAEIKRFQEIQDEEL